MATKTSKSSAKQSTAKTAAEVGAGLAAVAAVAGAGYYFYASPKAKKHRAAASKWAQGMKADVLKEARKLKKVDQKQIANVVDAAAAAYATARSVNAKDLKAAANELKRNWKNVQAEIGSRAAKAVKSVRKAASKKAPKRPAAKKGAKKAPKKAKKAAKKSPKRSR